MTERKGQHTPGPWEYRADEFNSDHIDHEGDTGSICAPDGNCSTPWYVAEIHWLGDQTEANAHRIVDCVNACEGIANPLALREAVEALEEIVRDGEIDIVSGTFGTAATRRLVDAARTALAKIKGEG